MTTIIATLLTFGISAAADGAPSVTQDDTRKLQGNWTVVRARRDGEVDNGLVNATLVITENKFTSKADMKTVAQGTWKIDATKQPRTIDIEYTEGPEKGQTAHGIYALTDGAWILLLNSPGRDRPVSFTPESETGHTFLVLKPAKP